MSPTVKRVLQVCRDGLSWWLEELRDLGAETLGRLAPARMKHVELPLPPESVLVRTVTFPRISSNQLRMSLDLQLEHLMPLKRNQVYWDFQHHAQKTDSGAIEVELAIVRRSLVNDQLSHARALGLTPRRVYLAGVGTDAIEKRFDFLPRFRSAPRLEIRDRWLSAIAVGWLIAIVAVTGWQWHTEMAAIEAALADARTAALKAMEIRTVATRKSDILAALAQALDKPSPAEVLAELTARLPPETWVFQFDMKDGAGSLSGIAPPYVNTAQLLEPSPVLKAVTLKSSTPAGTNTGHDRVELGFRVEREKTP